MEQIDYSEKEDDVNGVNGVWLATRGPSLRVLLSHKPLGTWVLDCAWGFGDLFLPDLPDSSARLRPKPC